MRLQVPGLTAATAWLARMADRLYKKTHPVHWLRWSRAGMLALILIAGASCLLVTSLAHGAITTATSRGANAVNKVGAAYTKLTELNKAETTASLNTLTGPGASYEDDITAASQDLVLAAENNVDGGTGSGDIQFAEGLLITYSDLIQQAGTDEATAGGATLADAELRYASTLLKDDVLSSLREKLRKDELQAVQSHLGSVWLNPVNLWLLLLAPFLAMLLLAAATSYVLWRGFRRLLSVRLTAALAATFVLVVLMASLNMFDSAQARGFYTPLAAGAHYTLGGTGFASSPWTLAAALILVLGAITMAFAAYSPRLAEYRYQP